MKRYLLIMLLLCTLGMGGSAVAYHYDYFGYDYNYGYSYDDFGFYDDEYSWNVSDDDYDSWYGDSYSLWETEDAGDDGWLDF